MNAGSQDDPGNRTPGTVRKNLNTATIPVSDNRIHSRDVFASSREILIVHGDEIYRLRLTAQNKLILTK